MSRRTLDTIRSKIIRSGYEYWKSKCDGNKLPTWSDINPADIKPLLPNIVVIHVLQDPLDFLEKITGEMVLARSVLNSMGKNWRDYEGRGPESVIWGVFEDVVNSKQPSFQTIPYVGKHKEFMEIETVICPLSSDGETIDRIISFVDYIRTTDELIEKEIIEEQIKRFTI